MPEISKICFNCKCYLQTSIVEYMSEHCHNRKKNVIVKKFMWINVCFKLCRQPTAIVIIFQKIVKTSWCTWCALCHHCWIFIRTSPIFPKTLNFQKLSEKQSFTETSTCMPTKCRTNNINCQKLWNTSWRAWHCPWKKMYTVKYHERLCC